MLRLTKKNLRAFLEEVTRGRDSAIKAARNFRTMLAEGTASRPPEWLVEISEGIAKMETIAATYNAFIPGANHPNPDAVLPEHVASRFITESLRPADATYSGTGNGLRLIIHKARRDTLDNMKPMIFEQPPSIPPK